MPPLLLLPPLNSDNPPRSKPNPPMLIPMSQLIAMEISPPSHWPRRPLPTPPEAIETRAGGVGVFISWAR
ncbi:hypothetical protein DSO57_1025489 [Entomophthora muscae]|uniref:Uncharacterized protein n=1 Tax=Entomophthora muscae TaxID=34485 RepID=A0ACC2TPT6_9FUNG|nr:hypothetical protein DSO57_1025489 [Entomophthora muscae]